MASVLPSATRAVVWPNVPTTDPVAFIRPDDGYPGYDDPAAAELVEAGLVVNPFITYYAAQKWPPSTDPDKVAHVEYLRRFLQPGQVVGCHYKGHEHMAGLPYATQYDDLGKAINWLGRADLFGTPPRIFAPPYGEFDENTLLAARARGMGVIPGWTHDSSDIAAGKPLRRGDIILCHFNANLYTDLTAAAAALAAAGLTPALLEDYIL